MPALTSFAVANYRSFVDRTRIELRPLTLLFGPNNAGKSALLRVLPLVADSILDSGRSPLKLGEASRGGSFEDLVSRIHPGRGLGLELAWDTGAFGARIRYLSDLYRQIVTEMKVSEGSQTVEAQWIPEEDAPGRPGIRYDLKTTTGSAGQEARFEFYGLKPGIAIDTREVDTIELFDTLNANLEGIAGGLQWLGSLRALPERSFKPSGAAPIRLGHDGSGFSEALFFDKVERGGLLEEVSAWYEEHFRQILDLVETGDTAYLALSPIAAAGLRIPLADTGEGIAQVLPVLVALASARRAAEEAPQILAIEQPELHLHPAAEVALGRRLAEIASGNHTPTMLVETHSENLMLSIQLQIAKGILLPTSVLGYWIERLDDGRSVARRIDFDDAGKTRGWPEGIFSEDIDLARQLFQLRREKRAS